MKTAILLCTKDTNNYLCEYVEYYRKLNFSNIILVDNSKEDNVYDILDKDDDFIIYEDYKERQFNHTIFVKEVFTKYYDKYDYIAIFDIDEFLTLNKKYKNNIENYLKESFCKKYDEILIHWKNYTSNDLTYYDNKPVLSKFHEESTWGSWEIKSIINCNTIKKKLTKDEIIASIYMHGIDHESLLCCSNNGKSIQRFNSVIKDVNYDCAELRHYVIKSLEEMIRKITINKSNDYSPNANLWKFYLYNNKKFTKQQLNYIENLIVESHKPIKVALCCIIKYENLYLREFIEYYLKLGIDRIYIYDNNDYERPELVIGDYVASNKVVIIDYRKEKECQTKAYNDFCKNYLKEYDWACFFDCDEFLTLNNYDNIKQYLKQHIFDPYSYIILHWVNYTDNDLLYYDGRKVQERFTTHTCPLWEFKTILRNTKETQNVSWKNTHLPDVEILHCNDIGEPIIWPEKNKYDVSEAYIKHYMTKTISEFCEIKCKRGDAVNLEMFKDKYTDSFFFSINKRTPEKEALFDKLMKK